jgi:hypothetical protein
MAYDIALSENFDLIVTAARDLAGIEGDNLTAQRIKIRLRIPFGSWVLDDTNSLGSYIHQHFGSPANKFIERLPQLIRQALSDMDDIEIVNVVIEQVAYNQVLAKIFFRRVADETEFSSDVEATIQEAIVQIGTGE